MNKKIRHSLIVAGTVCALSLGSTPTAGAYDYYSPYGVVEDFQQEALSATAVLSAASLGIGVAFWGTIYNFLVNHGTINGQIIPQLPVL